MKAGGESTPVMELVGARAIGRDARAPCL